MLWLLSSSKCAKARGRRWEPWSSGFFGWFRGRCFALGSTASLAIADPSPAALTAATVIARTGAATCAREVGACAVRPLTSALFWGGISAAQRRKLCVALLRGDNSTGSHYGPNTSPRGGQLDFLFPCPLLLVLVPPVFRQTPPHFTPFFPLPPGAQGLPQWASCGLWGQLWMAKQDLWLYELKQQMRWGTKSS